LRRPPPAATSCVPRTSTAGRTPSTRSASGSPAGGRRARGWSA
jgi:hypothetical protein